MGVTETETTENHNRKTQDKQNLIRLITKGYLKTLFKLLYAFLFVLSIVAVCAVLIFPFWFLATHYKRIFNYIFLALTMGLLIFLIGFKIKRSNQPISRILLKILKTTVKYILLFTLGYFILLLYIMGYYIYAIPATLGFIFLLGYIRYVHPQRNLNSSYDIITKY